MPAPPWAVGMRKIGTGLYVDAAGAAHLDPAEICAELGAPPTPENLAIAARAAADVFREQFGRDLRVTLVD